MSNSYFVDLVNTGWTDISQGNTVGFMTNIGVSSIHYIQADSLPSPSILLAHPLEAFDSVNFALLQGETVFGRSVKPTEQIIVTPGV